MELFLEITKFYEKFHKLKTAGRKARSAFETCRRMMLVMHTRGHSYSFPWNFNVFLTSQEIKQTFSCSLKILGCLVQ